MALSFFGRGMTETSRAGSPQPEVEHHFFFFCWEIRTSRRQSTSGHIAIHMSRAADLRGGLSLPWSSSDISVLGTGDAPKLKQMDKCSVVSLGTAGPDGEPGHSSWTCWVTTTIHQGCQKPFPRAEPELGSCTVEL